MHVAAQNNNAMVTTMPTTTASPESCSCPINGNLFESLALVSAVAVVLDVAETVASEVALVLDVAELLVAG